MAKLDNRLGIHEAVLLLALNDKKGSVIGGTWYTMSIGGAILAELILRERVEIESEGEKNFLRLVNKETTGDAVLDAALARINAAKRRRPLEIWVSRLAGMKNLRHRIARQLCDRKILRAREKRVFWFFTQRLYPQRDSRPEKEILARLRNAIFTSGRDADPRTVVLLSLAYSSGLLAKLFDKKRLKSRKSHIENLVQGARTGNATKKAIQSAQAAILVASTISTLTLTSSTVHH